AGLRQGGLREGGLRLRQRPGPKNSLGLVKFIFPNDANVYLHDTPAAQLFGRARRDFSHGCVRVEDPVALAQWVLKDQPDWTRERIQAAMAGTSSLRVDLTRPLPVILFYMTAMVMPADQALHFASDIYGHDARLARALASRRVVASF
ncbi:MAG: L,D-transpeptidase family protein, partial [Variovorax sp.]|nr:L,D-transpeptidase family protein [Variovorax sp.]